MCREFCGDFWPFSWEFRWKFSRNTECNFAKRNFHVQRWNQWNVKGVKQILEVKWFCIKAKMLKGREGRKFDVKWTKGQCRKDGRELSIALDNVESDQIDLYLTCRASTRSRAPAASQWRRPAPTRSPWPPTSSTAAPDPSASAWYVSGGRHTTITQYGL